ncbi:hypothetical protein FisN_8Hh402 [Fistulifera solaris]|uniref:Uncharacterized protein n=1 Tax=Fistulifera solaris TaxID=1519565 RepID=A0A1Z5JND9_FISSO|nr:hypothetical protein FisN_8Hh402 [Fistulifera solaris]|eukprot:GAX15301.1 hypothetical protein FisN_8Hh402 [Fistulifera solaris]
MPLSMSSCQQRKAPSKTLIETALNVSPHQPTTPLSFPSKKGIQDPATAGKKRTPQRQSPVTSLDIFLASSSRKSKNRVKSPKGVTELPGKSSSLLSPTKNDFFYKMKQEDPPAVVASEQPTQSPHQSAVKDAEGCRTTLSGQAKCEKSPTCCPALDSIASTSSDVSPQKPKRISDAEPLASDNKPPTQPSPTQCNTAQDKTDPVLNKNVDSIPTKPARTLSKGAKTQNAVFRPKTPQKRFLKKGIKLSPTLFMASISSRAAKMKAIAESPKALRNLFVGIVSPKSADDDTHSIETPTKNTKTAEATNFRRMMAPDLTVSASEANDSSSSLKISDLSDTPSRAKQISLPELLGRSLQHDVNGEDSMDDMFGKDGESETTVTEDQRTPLCYDRWHCSTPCLPSPSFAFHQTSVRRLACSPTHGNSNSKNNSVNLQLNASSSSDLFMPTKPRRYNSRDCS